jgi:nickel-type superoxide dismutase maturation protease
VSPFAARAVPVIAVIAGALVTARCRLVAIEGSSMLPTLAPGDRVLVLPLPLGVGDIVAVPDPRTPERLLVKRIAAIDPRRRTVRVLGDNPAASTDSRAFGPVARSTVVGRVIYRYAPKTRAGLLLGANNAR